MPRTLRDSVFPPLFTFILAVCLAAQPPQPSTTGLFRLSTLAGGLPLGDGGPAASAIFNRPAGVAVDPAGRIYVADTDNHRIRLIPTSGTPVSTYAGGSRGNLGDGGPASSAQLSQPTRLLHDGGSFLYVIDSGNNRVRRINTGTGIIEAFAGTGVSGSTGDGEPARNALFRGVNNLALDERYVYLVDGGNHRVRRVDRQTGVINAFAGSGIAGFAGDNGPASSAQLNSPTAIAVAPSGQVMIMDNGNGRARQVDPNSNTIRTFITFTGFSITDLLLDRPGNVLYFSWPDANQIYSYDLTTNVPARVAGVSGFYGLTGDGGPATSAMLNAPRQLALEASGSILFADQDNHRVRRLDLQNRRVITLAGRSAYGGDETSITGSILFAPSGVAADSQGNLYISENGNCVIRRVDAATQLMTRHAGVVGLCKSIALDNIPARSATLSYPYGLAVDKQDNLYVADSGHGSIRRIDKNGTITTLLSSLSSPRSLAIDPRSQTLYVAEFGRNRVIAIDLGSPSNYTILAGQGTCAYSGDQGSAAVAGLCAPNGVAVAADGAVLIADTFNNAVRRVDPVTRIITTIAGTGAAAIGTGSNFTPASTTPVAFPGDVDVDSEGNLYVTSSNRVLRITPGGQAAVIAGPLSNAEGYADGDPGTTGRLNFATNIRVAANGNVYFTDSLNHRIRQLTPIRATALQVVSGTPQTVVAGGLSAPLVVSAAAGSLAAPGVDVAWAVTSGGGALSAPVTTSGADGRAGVTLRLSATPGTSTVTATAAGFAPVVFSVTVPESSGGGGGGGGGSLVARPVIAAAASAGAFGTARSIAPGGWLEIFGKNLSPVTRSWGGADFKGAQAPVSLDGVRVTVDGRPAFVAFVSPSQINVQVPDGIATGRDVQVVVQTPEASSDGFLIAAVPRAPGLLAPPSFSSNGRQYMAALHADGTFAGPEGLVPGVAFRRAAAGDTLLLYGVGFGATSPAVPAGQITGTTALLPGVDIRFGNQSVAVAFAGLAPGLVGLYQFNVTVPPGLEGDVPLAVSVGGVAVPRALFIALR